MGTETDVVALLEELRRLGKPNTARIYGRHGVRDEAWGVSYADLGRLAKSLKGRADLAAPLWASGVHDARVLATRLASPDALPDATIDAWIADARDRVTANAVADVVAARKDAPTLSRRWIDAPDEWVSTAGWSVVACLAMAGRFGDDTAGALVARIRDEIHASPNMTRHAMNMALIAIAIGCPAVRPAVIEAAAVIGPVIVDHGQTGCVTPAIVPYVERAVARQSSRRASVP